MFSACNCFFSISLYTCQIEEEDNGLPPEQDAFHQVPPSRPLAERPKAVRPQRPAASAKDGAQNAISGSSSSSPMSPNRGQVIDRTPPPPRKGGE